MKPNWSTTALQDLCNDVTQDIVDGPFGSTLQRKDYVNEGFPVLKIQNIKPFRIELKKMDYVTPAKLEALRRHSFRRGDIVLTKLGDPLGVSALVEGVDEGLIVADLVRIRAQKISGKYLCYHLNSPGTSTFINSAQKGTTRPRVTLSIVRELPIAVPTPEEQQRIVSVLDESFEGLASARESIERNVRSARALFDDFLPATCADRGAQWERQPLASVCELFVDSAHRTPKYQPDGLPALRPRDVVNGRLELSDAARVSDAEYQIQSRRHKPAPGDIVYSRELSYGWAALLPETPRVCLSQGMCLFRPTPRLDSAFLVYVLNGSIGREQAHRAAVGAAHPHVNLSDIKAFQIPLPPIEEQRRLVESLRSLEEECQALGTAYRQKLVALDELKDSLLHHAFTGQL